MNNVTNKSSIVRVLVGLFSLLLLPLTSPANSPNSQSASSKGRIYSTKIGTQSGYGSFSIAVPTSVDAYENREMKHKTNYEQFCTYTSFGPFATDLTVFRVQVCKKSVQLNSQILNNVFSNIISVNVAAYRARNVKIVSKRAFNLNGHRAYFMVYTQVVPGKLVLNNLDKESNQTQTQAVYVVDYNKYLVVFNIQASDAGAVNKIDASNRFKMSKRIWRAQNKFVNSFRLNP